MCIKSNNSLKTKKSLITIEINSKYTSDKRKKPSNKKMDTIISETTTIKYQSQSVIEIRLKM